MLKTADYQVGNRGVQDAARRRRALAHVIKVSFPQSWRDSLGEDYLRHWGEASTWVRVERLVSTIRHLHNQAVKRHRKGKNGDQREAIRHYREDLAWLREKLMPKEPPFKWPTMMSL
ncbi:MAG: hypothetical protein H6722_07470 [Sandaracinus sp.]|nr:hypothetical protein [Sandaracinus sp.]MCB9612276.1 hypothetical protein [Sandaracinus sp.]